MSSCRQDKGLPQPVITIIDEPLRTPIVFLDVSNAKNVFDLNAPGNVKY